MTLHDHLANHHHTPLPIELSVANAVLLHNLILALLRAYPDVPLPRPTRYAISELRNRLHAAGKV